MFEINHTAVLVASIVTMALATVWYAPSVLGRSWIHAVGLSEEDMAAEAASVWKKMAVGFVLQLLGVYVLSHFLALAEAHEATSPVFAGFWAAALVSIIIASNAFWERRSFMYVIITAGYTFVMFVSAALIITYWPW